jgi:hypothetical protein
LKSFDDYWVAISILSRIDLANEAVAVAGQRFDKLGILGGVSQSLAESLHGVVQAVVELNESIRCP